MSSIDEDEFMTWNSKLLSELRRLHDKDSVSLALVGSHRIASVLYPVHDIDIVLVLRTLDVEAYRKTATNLSDICHQVSSSTILATPEMRIGPFLPAPPVSHNRHVQLHLLLFDLSLWKDRHHLPHHQEWIRCSSTLAGNTLAAISSCRTLSVEALLGHLDHQINTLERRRVTVYGYKDVQLNFARVRKVLPLSDDLIPKVCLGFVLNTVKNLRRLQDFLDPPLSRDCRRELERTMMRSKRFLDWASVWRDSLRLGRPLAPDQASDELVRGSLNLLHALRNVFQPRS